MAVAAPARAVRLFRKTLTASALFLAIFGAPLSAQQPEGIPRLQQWTKSFPGSPPEGISAWSRAELDLAVLGGRGRSVRLSPADPGRIEIELPDGTPLFLGRTDRRRLARGGYAWIGSVLGGHSGQAHFVVRDGLLVGSVRRPGLNLQIRPEPDGSHRFEVRDEAWWPEQAEDVVPVWNPPAAHAEETTVPAGSPLVDVLVVYTAATRSGAGGIAAIEALIDLAELETNTSYANSGVDQRIRVVHRQEVTYTESGSTETDLSRLSGTLDGYMDEVHALRDTYGADFVSLWVESGGCGIGYLMTSVTPAFAPAAFNVCQRSCATGNLTFGHELGHNMSLRHDWYVDDGTSPYDYNHGYVHIDDLGAAQSFRTVMAYGTRCSAEFNGSACTRLQQFSNPDVSIGSDPTGVAPGTSLGCSAGVAPTAECDADSRLALNNSAAITTAFRPTKVIARIAKEVDVDFASIGDTMTYTLTVSNDSDTTAAAVVLSDTVPANTTLDPSSLSLDASATGNAAGSLITWTTGVDLAPGDELVRTFSVTATSPGIATNTAAVDSSSTSLTVTSNTVSTGIWENASCGFSDDFASGQLSHFWRVETTAEGRARVLTGYPDPGSAAAVLDDAVPGGATSLASITLAANLAEASTAELSFRWLEAGDENGGQDGVFVREADGDPWVSALPFTNVTNLVFQNATIDLVQAASSNGLTLGDGFQVRFQFADNYSFDPGYLAGSDGYMIDDVALSCECSHELSGDSVNGPAPILVESPCTILAGPSYNVGSSGDLTLRSPQGVVLRNGFSVLTGGTLTIEL